MSGHSNDQRPSPSPAETARPFEGGGEGTRLEAELRQQIESLTESNRNKDRFLSILGHELRNPIAAISMAGEALTRLCSAEPDKRTLIDVVCRQSRDAGRLLEEVLDVARLLEKKIELHREKINLTAHLQKAVADLQSTGTQRRAAIRLDDSPVPIWIHADPVRVDKVLRSVIGSAADFSNSNGDVCVTCRLAVNTTEVLIDVHLSNLAIDRDALSTIFQPFHRQLPATQKDRKSLGLDLVLAKGFTELHGGRLETESVGNGAIFHIVLPAAGETSGVTAPPQTVQHGARPLRILLIEDSGDIVASLQFLLKSAGHDLSVAANGRQGIEAARRLKPEVILCDIGLPDIDGYAVAKQLRADPMTSSIYLVAVSGFASEEDQRRSHDAGFDLHLNKPQGFVGLDQRLRELPIARQ